jgi:serine/threonine-protein kinase
MGVVYAAEDLACTERVAIKVAQCERVGADLVADHMARELRAGRATRHPNVVRILDGGIEARVPYVVMELAPGRPLGVVAAEDRLSIRRVAEIVDQVLAGVAAIHHAGYLHGDIKTDNVLVERGESGAYGVKLIDLGLACEQGDLAPTFDDDHIISGTPHYLAPELALGGAKTVASEMYAVGVVLYELLTGTTPFTGGGILEILRQQIEDEVMPPSLRSPELKLSLALERVVLRALNKDPNNRFASATEFQCALRTATRGTRDELIACRELSTTGPTDEWTRPELPSRAALGTPPPIIAIRDPNPLVERALDATRVHLAAHRLSAARDELEAAVRLLQGDALGEREVWRLLLPLAAVCDSMRDPCRARRLARVALDGAARAGSDVGRHRAKALIERFAGRSRLRA